jgi:hypothetical protein
MRAVDLLLFGGGLHLKGAGAVGAAKSDRRHQARWCAGNLADACQILDLSVVRAADFSSVEGLAPRKQGPGP